MTDRDKTIDELYAVRREWDDALVTLRNKLKERDATIAELRAQLAAERDKPRMLQDTAEEMNRLACDYISYKNGNIDLRRKLEASEARNAYLEKLKEWCEDCGGEYAATGIESGCPCKLKRKLDVAREALVYLLSYFPAFGIERPDNARSKIELALAKIDATESEVG